ncbi:unnamed protein product [Gemmataceae bacterium]|nr:unnamed protein product [Gemmataceae bacterium]VTU00989.1 unnamed protein product [Gemmataceae bacterium]
MRVRIQFWPLLILAAATWLASPDPVAGRPYDAVTGTYPVVAAGQFVVTKAPVKDGVRATADLPASQHKRNTGGNDRTRDNPRGEPGKGYGLCVYTSAWHAALWQSVAELYGFRDWMKNHPGGSYPEKFEATLNAYCREKGIPIPNYVQHTGGDEDALRLALKTGRMVCVTYCGVDGPGRYGSDVVGHMVNLVHLDDSVACVLDNNFPGTFLWMTRQDFLCRWRGVQPNGRAFMGQDERGRLSPIGGGWAIVLLGPPPAPYPHKPAVQSSAADAGGSESPVLYGQNCKNGQCVLPAQGQAAIPVAQPAAVTDGAGQWRANTNGREWGYWVNGRCVAAAFADGRCEACNERGVATGTPIDPPAPLPFPVANPVPVAAAAANEPPAADFPRNGVDAARMNAETSYRHNGERVSKAEFAAALALTDDSGRWNLGVVGDPAFARKVRDDVAALPAPLRDKLHVQTYAPDHWAAAQFGLAAGVTLRKPAVGRVGQDVGAVTLADYSPVSLMDLLTASEGPAPKPAPAPSPKPKSPDPVIEPAPPAAPKQPNEEPKPPPAAPTPGIVGHLLLVAILGGVAYLIFRK